MGNGEADSDNRGRLDLPVENGPDSGRNYQRERLLGGNSPRGECARMRTWARFDRIWLNAQQVVAVVPLKLACRGAFSSVFHEVLG
jgi:hypothetical protein